MPNVPAPAADRRVDEAAAWLVRRDSPTAADHADVVVTPMAGCPAPHIADTVGRGLARSLYFSNVAAWAAPWNAIGQPAASVPVGFDADGLPMAVQLCGRPHDEVTLLRLAAQLERAHPWAQHRPPGVLTVSPNVVVRRD